MWLARCGAFYFSFYFNKEFSMYCEKCGKRIAETAKFCPYCGNAVGIVDSGQSQQSVKQEISTPTSQEAKQEQKYVGFWARFAANFLDGILINILCSPAWIFLNYRARYHLNDRDVENAIVLYSALYILAQIILLVLWFVKRASVGKMAISAKIVDAKTGGAPTKKQLIGRYFAYLLSSLPLCLGFLWIAFDPKKQGWHDKLAGTAVIYV